MLEIRAYLLKIRISLFEEKRYQYFYTFISSLNTDIFFSKYTCIN